MNVLYVCGSFPKIKCGVGDYTEMLYKSIKTNTDINAFVLTSNEATYEDSNVFCSMKKWTGPYLVKNILKHAKMVKADVIHFQFPASKYKFSSIFFLIFLPIILKMKRIKFIFTLHEYSDNRKMVKFALRTIIKKSNKIIVVDERFKKEIQDKYNFDNNKISYIQIGSNIAKSKLTVEEKKTLRDDFMKKMDCEKIIAYFGFINEAKCISELMGALGQIKKEEKTKFCLLIIGDFNDEKCSKEYFNEIIKVVDEYSLKANIYSTGFVDENDVSTLLSISDFVVLPFKNGVSLRNGSMLASYQEGLKILTSFPKDNNIFFSQKQFSFFDNTIDSMKRLISNQMKQDFVRYDDGISVLWSDIAKEHYECYSNLLMSYKK